MWQFAGRSCRRQPRTETMPAVFRSSPADFQTGIAFIYDVADSTSDSTQDVVWKMVGKAYWRILCGQVGTKLMNCHYAKFVHFFPCILILLLQQGPEHMPQMHRSLQAYCGTLTPPLWFRRSYFRRQVPPRPYDARDPSSERWNCGRECWPVILPKCRLTRYI